MIQKIKDYALFLSLIALAILYYLLGRNSDKVKNLQHKLLLKDLGNTLNKAREDVANDTKTYEEAYRSYTSKRNAYLKLIGRKPKQ